jgi:hypothetical protein
LPNERDGGRPAEICGRGDGGRLNTLVLQTWDRRDRGTFFCVNTVTPGQARRSKETVHEVTCLHCDLDFSKIDTAPDTVLQQLRALEYPPSKIVRSGHGLHGYWLLREPPAATPETVLQAETALRGIADILGRDPAVAEIARLMRLPGSHNTKNGERLPVTVIFDTGARYSCKTWPRIWSPGCVRDAVGQNNRDSCRIAALDLRAYFAASISGISCTYWPLVAYRR